MEQKGDQMNETENWAKVADEQLIHWINEKLLELEFP